MAHAERCPICHGKGKTHISEGTTSSEPEMICHGCNGRGWITVQDW